MNRDSERSPQSSSQPDNVGNADQHQPLIDENQALESASALDRVRSLSHLLDNAIPVPGTNYSFGLDPIIGLLPAGGDLVGTILSAYIVLEGTRFRLSIPTLSRMVFNIVLEMIVGAIPFIGDLFDVGWKANVRNLRLIESHLQNPTTSRAADNRFFIILVLVFLLIIGAQIVWYIVLFRWIANIFLS
jgi:hypothetical protein